MSGTYARVMRATDRPGDRRAVRSHAPQRPTAVSDSVAGISVMTGTPLDTAHDTKQDSSAEATFAAAVAAFAAGQDAQRRSGLEFEEVPAPKRLAPYATAVAATVQRGEVDVAWGRLVLLYDPDGQQGWEGFFRLVAYVRADVEPEMAADPLLGEVGWSWLAEALDAQVPGYTAPSGTVTRVITEGFGGKRDEVPLTGFELRASWSPTGAGHRPGFTATGDTVALDLPAHIAAWCDCMSAAAGLEPPGTRALHQPGHG
jgi:Protein of unknown function (DUF3000)